MLSPVFIRNLKACLGEENVLLDPEDLICYSFDAASGIPPRKPGAVAIPRSREQVSEILRVCSRHGVPVYPRGSGTNLTGGTVPSPDGIVLSMVELSQILDIDAENLTATAEPGVVIDKLNKAVAQFGLMYPPDPGTVATCTLGGSVAECSGGLRGLKYGVTRDYVMGLEVVVADGSIIRVGGKTVKNVSGYDLTRLFVGSEGTLGIFTQITVRLVPAPQARRSMLAVFDSVDKAGQTVADIIIHRVVPATLEIMDDITIRSVEAYTPVGLPVGAAAVLFIEVDGYPEVVEREAGIVRDICQTHQAQEVRVAKDEVERDRLWEARRVALPALARVKPTTILEDATVPRSKIPNMLSAIKEVARKYSLTIGTFGHAGDGNLHPTILTDASNTEEMTRVKAAIEEIFQTALSLGGTLSGEHGIGIAKAEFMEWEFGPAGLDLMQRVKKAFDPQNILNPGKVVRRAGD